jgi:REP element-mobilizing transposase RayT
MGDRPQTVHFWRGRLPHWEVADGRYFVTVRLAGCLPQSARERLRELAARAPGGGGTGYLEWSRQYFRLQEQLLHGSHDRAWLGRTEIAETVRGTASHYDETGKWRLSASIVMPNHVHLFFAAGTCGLTKAMKDFKHVTARNARAYLPDEPGPFWQKEWFDHWSRSPQEDDKIRDYIRENAVRAGLVKEWRQWPWVWLRNP